jgi:cytoskeleton protein RodZ
MSEDDLKPAAGIGAAQAQAPTAFGARLAWERERAGLSVSDVAAHLRLHPKKVRALEQEDLAALPEMAYVRGFVRSYARMLGLEAESLLADLNAKAEPAAGSVVDGMKHSGDYSPVRAAAREQMSRQLAIGLALVGLIALGLTGWYATQQRDTVSSAPPAPPAAPAAVVAPAPPADKPTTAAETGADLPAAESAPAPEESAATSDAAASSAVASAPLALLTLAFSGPSWAEVTDASGKVLLSQLNKAGDAHQLNGAPPLAVVIGDASRASVQVRGEPFDLAQVTRLNVARFSVK